MTAARPPAPPDGQSTRIPPAPLEPPQNRDVPHDTNDDDIDDDFGPTADLPPDGNGPDNAGGAGGNVSVDTSASNTSAEVSQIHVVAPAEQVADDATHDAHTHANGNGATHESGDASTTTPVTPDNARSSEDLEALRRQQVELETQKLVVAQREAAMELRASELERQRQILDQQTRQLGQQAALFEAFKPRCRPCRDAEDSAGTWRRRRQARRAAIAASATVQ